MVKAAMIHHMNVPIDDIDRARDFYGRVLGLPQIKRPDVGRPGLWYGCGANELHLSVREGLRGGHVAFTMSGSLDEIARHLEAERIPFARGRAGLPQIFCEDPAGNLVELNTGWVQEPLG
jgi:catechol 2,3-dioxygenase-like lactoylglutathione lyase family enzyme